MNYYSKYLKYKSKYLTFKNSLMFSQYGGSGGGGGGGGGGELEWTSAVEFGKMCNDTLKKDGSKNDKPKFPRDLDLTGWMKADINIDDKVLNVVKKTLNEDEGKPVLVAMAGISLNSFCGSAEIIVRNIDKLKNKFKAVYIINQDPYKAAQNKVCEARDAIVTEKKLESRLRKELSQRALIEIYKPEIDLMIEMAKVINRIITGKLHLNNVHLLGKCNGGGIALELVSLSNVYKALYLAVPGNPIHIQPLMKLSPDRLEEISFIFGWNKNDNYDFKFQTASINEKAVYDEEIGKLEKALEIKLNYESYVFKPGNGHEINDKLIDKIAKSD
jgi:hypothetical protein